MRNLLATPIVITHMTAENRLPDMPWLESDYGIRDSEWIILFPEVWSALADGDPATAADLELRLALTFEIHRPRFVLVVGFSPIAEQQAPSPSDQRTEEVVSVVRSFQFPATVEGVCVDHDGVRRELVQDAVSQLVPA
ncbi:MAG: hypothetical protein WBD40_18800 [Tepidisphaeraceae bacterium]